MKDRKIATIFTTNLIDSLPKYPFFRPVAPTYCAKVTLDRVGILLPTSDKVQSIRKQFQHYSAGCYIISANQINECTGLHL